MVRFGIYTDDFRFYYRAIKTLKEWKLPYCSIDNATDIPIDVPIVLSSLKDEQIIKFQIRENSPERAIRKALPTLAGKREFTSLIIGIDPGPKPGVAVSADMIIVEAKELPSVSDAVLFVKGVLTDYNYKQSKIKLGNGDKPNRKKLIFQLVQLDVEVNIVNEKGTSGPHAIHNNALSAARITLIDDSRFRNFKTQNGIKRRDAIDSEFRTLKIFV
ncbi:MAG: hypothetical protein ACYCR7_00435 [Thermoplasmataceae archaeon]